MEIRNLEKKKIFFSAERAAKDEGEGFRRKKKKTFLFYILSSVSFQTKLHVTSTLP